MKRKVLSIAGASAALLLGLTACGSPQEEKAEGGKAVEVKDLDSLVAAAEGEGSLLIYGQIPEESLAKFSEGFQEKYDIKVESLRLGGNTLASRFEAEAQAGTQSADLVIPVDVEFIKNSVDEGSLVGFSDTGVGDLLEGFPEEAVLSDYNTPLLQLMDVGFIYNTDLVNESELPKTWADLHSDRWAGKYCAVDPETSLNVGHFFWKLKDDEGEEAVKEFGADNGRWYSNVVAMNEAVAVGECELGVGSAKFFVEQARGSGAAVESAPQPMSIRPLTSVAVASEAKSPNAARLFMHYILTEEGNSLMNDASVGSLGPWDVNEFPEDFYVPTPEEFESVRAELNDVVALLK